MIEKSAQDPTYSTRHLWQIFQISESTWGNWRQTGRGPSFEVDVARRTVTGPGNVNPKIYYRHSSLLVFTGGRWPCGGKFIKTKLAAKMMGKSPAALRKLRSRGSGPVPVHLEGLVRYMPEDIECWTQRKEAKKSPE